MDKHTATKMFMSNGLWKEYLEKAPSDKCKRYIQCQFYYSVLADDKAESIMKDMDRLEAEMGLNDWKHLYKYAGNSPFKAVCKKKIEEFSMG